MPSWLMTGCAGKTIPPSPLKRTSNRCSATWLAHAGRRGKRPKNVAAPSREETPVAVPKHRRTAIKPEAEKRQKSAPRAMPSGTDLAVTLQAQGKSLPLTYWDVWFALAGDLGRLAERLGGENRLASFQRESVER